MSLGEPQIDALALATCGGVSASNPAEEGKRPGRDGLLRLGFERTGIATVLRRCRYTLPLQVLSPLALADGSSYLLLLNPTGGVVGGDHLRTEITVGDNAHACLSTPSATRVYRTNSTPAEMHTQLRVGRNATLEYLPDHVIPHPGSSLRQSLRIEMEEGSRGIFFDGFSCGRIAMNERWQFRDFDSRTEISLRGQPLFANRTKIAGAKLFRGSELHLRYMPTNGNTASAAEENNLSGSPIKRMGGYSYCGSLAIIADGFDNWRALVESLRLALDATPEIFGGASLLAHSGCSVRYLAHSAIEFHVATQSLWTIARKHLLKLPPFELRKY